jgi:hypothetical protein
MPFIRLAEYLVECRCLLTSRDHGGCCCCLPPIGRCCYSTWTNAGLFWFISLLLVVIGWWTWFIGLSWSSYYVIENAARNDNNVTVTPTQPHSYIMQQHFPMQLFHMTPGIMITIAYLVRVWISMLQNRNDDPFQDLDPNDTSHCDAGKVKMAITVLCAGSGIMICILWMMMMLSFGSFSVTIPTDGLTSISVTGGAYLVPLAAVLFQCVLLLLAIACSYWAQIISRRRRRSELLLPE